MRKSVKSRNSDDNDLDLVSGLQGICLNCGLQSGHVTAWTDRSGFRSLTVLASGDDFITHSVKCNYLREFRTKWSGFFLDDLRDFLTIQLLLQ